jgi:L-fuconolactonase
MAITGSSDSQRVDSHHHLWDLRTLDRDWIIGEKLAPIKRTFAMEEFLEERASSGIDLSILVQSASSYAEIREMFDLAKEHRSIAGLVAWIDMSAIDCIYHLDTYLDLHGAEHLVGIRDGAQGRADIGWLNSQIVVQNVKKLASRNLAFDLLVDPPHLPASVSLVNQVPEVTFILDHIGKPNIANGEISEWSSVIKELAKPENIYCKISGMATEADWKNWQVEDFRPYFEVVLDAFGIDRIMFGSDWPVCNLAASYQQVVEIAEYLVSELSESEKDNFWSKNARTAYAI